MQLITRDSYLWTYLQEEIKGLIVDGELLLDFAEKNKGKVSDFSYLVFPFAKAYEGFLKKFFLDLGMIREDEYYGDDIRIGRILNPNYIHEHNSVFKFMCQHEKGGEIFSKKLWEVWRKGRNQVFHYFPHNFRSLSYNEAMEIINDIVHTMSEAVVQCDIANLSRKIQQTSSVTSLN